MRKNLPVTQHNYIYPKDQTLISITDTKGRITYCNKDFIDVSGYDKSELLGQPHNVLRHPDMPEEAFRDFWDTIQKGRLWSALIKNRRKNGDSYWVRANATPMRNGDKIVGFLSVRTLPSPREIEQAEQLYATMRAQEQAGRLKFGFSRGRLRRMDILGKTGQKLRPGERGRLWLLTGMAGLFPVLAAWAGAPLAAITVAAVVGVVLARLALDWATLKPLNDVLKTARQLASGDLSEFVEIKGRGKAQALLLPIAQLALAIRTVMVDVRHDLGGLARGAKLILQSSQSLSAHSESQATSLEETAAAMDQISGTVQETTELANNGVRVAKETAGAVQRSQEVVHAVTATMQEIAESSNRIGHIINDIEGVAFQTNILALNAAVEAARAGEQGRGFAVVASEVRALAQRTTALSKEIHALVRESQDRVARGRERTDEAGARMAEVVRSVEQVKETLDHIHHAASEQAQGVEQITQAIQDLDGVTQKNAALAEELAISAEAFNREAQQANDNIRVFRLSPSDVTHAETDAVQLRKGQRDLPQSEAALMLQSD